MKSVREQLQARYEALLPEGLRARVCVRLPWQDEDGIWREPELDTYAVRIIKDAFVVDGIIHQQNLDLTDHDFKERLIDPCLALLNQA